MDKKKTLIGLAVGLSATLTWAAFAPLSEYANVAIAIAPMLAIARISRARTAAVAFFAYGFLHWFASLSWMPAIIKNNGPWPLVILGWIGLAALCASYEAIFGFISARLWKRARTRGVAVFICFSFLEAAIWAGLEHCRAVLFTGFSWNELGSALMDAPGLAAPARFIGVRGLSALVILVNGVFATLFMRAMRLHVSASRGRIARMAETAVPLVAVFLAFSLSRSSLPDVREMVPVKVALVQHNAPCVFSSDSAHFNPVAEIVALLSAPEVQGVDLVILPESAFCAVGSLDGRRAAKAASAILKAAGAYALLAGGDFIEGEGDDRRYYNAAALYVSDGESGVACRGLYAKQHLVPFGEYIPFDKTFKCLQSLSPIGVSLHAGECKVLDMGGLGIAPLICFEDTDSSLSAAAACAYQRPPYIAANIIALMTNDSWFSLSNEAIAHADQARARAVETGLPVVRVGNSGVTGVIDPDGRARWLMDGKRPRVDAPGVMVDFVLAPKSPVATFYATFGDMPLMCFFALAVIVALAPFGRFLRMISRRRAS